MKMFKQNKKKNVIFLQTLLNIVILLSTLKISIETK